MNKAECADMMADFLPNGKHILKEHLTDFSEILLHILAVDMINEPLIDLLKYHFDQKSTILSYCQMIEKMWTAGDNEVVNVVDVTILERLSDDEMIWQRFGTFISTEFKTYINKEVLAFNLMMACVAPLQ